MDGLRKRRSRAMGEPQESVDAIIAEMREAWYLLGAGKMRSQDEVASYADRLNAAVERKRAELLKLAEEMEVRFNTGIVGVTPDMDIPTSTVDSWAARLRRLANPNTKEENHADN
jgi:hypothetical protein